MTRHTVLPPPRDFRPMPSGTGGRFARQCSSASLFRKTFTRMRIPEQTGIAMMIARNAWELRGWQWSVLLVLAAAAGCSSRQSPEQRIKIALDTAGMTGTSLYPIAGTVTIDGVPPTFDEQRKHLVLMLY